MTINNTIDQNRAAAHRTITAFRRELEAIRADDTLSPVGKQQRISAEFDRAKEHVEKLRTHETTLIAERISVLERQLYGFEANASANAVIARRDADDRAAALADPGDAAELYRRAQLTGDAVLERSVALRAFEEGWQAITGDYLARRPVEAAAAQELATLREHAAAQTSAGLASLLFSQGHYTLTKPTEL